MKYYRLSNGKFTNRIVQKVMNSLFVSMGIFLVAYSAFNYWIKLPPKTTVWAKEGMVSPVPEVTPTPTVLPTATPTQEPEQAKIEQEIRKVFGEYADEALTVLRGDICAENRQLNPDAVNTNLDPSVEGKVLSRDWGIFQINDHWQGVSNTRFLKDPVINIRMAWRIFEDNGFSWDRWTCGRRYKFERGEDI